MLPIGERTTTPSVITMASTPRRRPPPVRRTVALLAAVAVAAGCGPVVELEASNPASRITQPQTSIVEAADGTLLARLHGEQDRRLVTLGEVADVAEQAVVAIEDRRFFHHAGVDLAAVARAAVRNATAGQIEEGGSTLTQQYVKKTITGSEQTLERKVREAVFAYQLEQRYPKEEILERYLNTVYFGRGAYGIAAAARRFFGVTPDRLTLEQSALLAGMIASPARLDPYDHPRAARARRGMVLDAMVDTGWLDRARARTGEAAPLDLAPLATDASEVAGAFVREVKRRLQHDPDARFALLGDDVDARADRLFTGGLRVITTLDPALQAQAEETVAGVLPADGPAAAVVVTDPRSGAVRALVGDPRHGPSTHFNLATQGRRQPGSAFKPIALATALSRGVSLDREFPGGACARFAEVAGWDDGVCNYGGTAYGPLTLREATVKSVNTTYARLAVELGPAALRDTAQALGLGRLPDVPAIALGAGEVTPMALAGAYGAFADRGRWRAPYLVERVETLAGEVLYEHTTEPVAVLDDAVAFLVTQTLQDVVRRGTGVRARIDRPQAGKTGTSQDSADAWFVGYTPSFLAAVWVGFPDGRVPMVPPTTSEVVEGGRWPAEIWRRLADRALENTEPEPFPAPAAGLVRVEVDASRHCLPNHYTPPELVQARSYVAGTEPTRRCTEPTGPPTDDVPEVVGLPHAEAESLLADRGFLLDVRPLTSRRHPPGVVVHQRPAPGGTTRPEDDHAVVLWVSQAPDSEAAVPDVVGLPAGQAVEALEAAGWVVDLRGSCPPAGCEHATPGGIWAQDPAPRTVAARHSLVTLDVVAAVQEAGARG